PTNSDNRYIENAPDLFINSDRDFWGITPTIELRFNQNERKFGTDAELNLATQVIYETDDYKRDYIVQMSYNYVEPQDVQGDKFTVSDNFKITPEEGLDPLLNMLGDQITKRKKKED